VAHVQAVLVTKDTVILTIGFLVKFKRSFRALKAPRALQTPWLGEAMVAILDFLSPQKLHFFS
jgi:hypothetical protein